MKKLFTMMCAMLLSVGAFAQKGQSAVGLNLNATPCLESGASLTNFGISAKYQYNITDPLRVEAVVGYNFKAKGMSLFESGVNVNWLFNVSSKIKVYPIIGCGYATLKGAVEVDEKSNGYYEEIDSTINKFYYNLGIGGEYAITNNLSACLEIKYQGISHFNRMPISLGVSYKF